VRTQQLLARSEVKGPLLAMATNAARKRVSETESGLNQSTNSDAAASSIMVKRPKVAGKGTGGRDGYLYYFRSPLACLQGCPALPLSFKFHAPSCVNQFCGNACTVTSLVSADYFECSHFSPNILRLSMVTAFQFDCGHIQAGPRQTLRPSPHV